MAGTNTTWVSQVNCCALEISGGQLVLAGTCDDVVVGLDELCEVLVLGLFQRGNDQRTGTIFLWQVDCQAQVDVFRINNGGLLAVDELVAHVHVWVLLRGLYQCIANDVGERNLATASALQMLVDQGTIFPHQFDGNVTHGGCGWNL